MGDTFYITTPLYYVNASPHIGHSYTTIAADCLARYMRSRAKGVYFLTGTDEHGQKIARAAQEAGVGPQEFVDTMVGTFVSLWKTLDISYDDFIRTTEPRHIRTVQYALSLLYEKDEIYQATYEGWYCMPCETFWTDMQVLEGAICPDCRRPVEKIREDNYFFRLSQYQDWLLGHIQSHPDFILPSFRRQEVVSFLERNRLTDLCISRPRSRLVWGIPLPFSGDHVTYVWFDALLNYISAAGFPDDEARFRRLWPADIHFIGKDILRQHAVYWPIILKALGVDMPRTIFAHGWWMVNEEKMSKSRGNVVNPLDMISSYGVDAYRFFLLRDVTFGLDGSFSEEALIKRINSDLANDLGNLLHRVRNMVSTYLEGRPPREDPALLTAACLKETRFQLGHVEKAMDDAFVKYDFSQALDSLWQLVNAANKSVEDMKPWVLSREGKKAELEAFLGLLVASLRVVAKNLACFLPQTARNIQEALEAEKIDKGQPLFPRIT